MTTMLLTASDVRRLLDMRACIDAVEQAFARAHLPTTLDAGALGTHVPAGGFHVKTAGLATSRSYYAAKINANFPRNPETSGLPTVQGVVALFDAACGRPLALMDSSEITSLRTAAASAVAARYLARPDAETIAVIGCGVQGRSHLRAMSCVRPIHRVYAHDAVASRARNYATEMSRELGIPVDAVVDVRAAVKGSDICVTCTPSRSPILSSEDVPDGVFVAAVGADWETKSEIAPELMARSVVVVDVLEQCLAFGDLHHAVAAGAMSAADVHASLAELASGRKAGRESPTDIVVFDSTGTALEDVAAAALVYERALESGHGRAIELAA